MWELMQAAADSTVVVPGPGAPQPSVRQRSSQWMNQHPVTSMIVRRVLLGVVTIVMISIIVFAATLVIPGNAATAILGRNAQPAKVKELEAELGLNEPVVSRFLNWAGDAIHGDFGNSLGEGQSATSKEAGPENSVTSIAKDRLGNSAVLVAAAAIISTLLGLLAGVYAAYRRDGFFDTVGSVVSLVASALPEFVVAIFCVLLFATSVFTWFPAISVLEPGQSILSEPEKLVLPVLALVIVVTPYMFRMTRGAMIEALDSDYVEFARMKGASTARVAFRHALPNALPPIIQVVGLNLLFLAGGIVLVEAIFNFPGIGSLLVASINGRNVNMIQYIVILLAVFYVLLNIITDVLVLLATPRRRYPR
jgi:peptide/nickel transport system permease protein